MKVEEEAPEVASLAAKLSSTPSSASSTSSAKADHPVAASMTLSSSSSDDSGCLAESPELVKEGDEDSDSTNCDDNGPANANSNETNQLSSVSQWIDNTADKPSVVTSYLVQISCNKESNSIETATDTNQNTNSYCNSVDNNFVNQTFTNSYDSNYLNSFSSPNNKNVSRSPRCSPKSITKPPSETRIIEEGDEVLVGTRGYSPLAVLDSTNANCQHEITFSLSQLSDFEATKQKISEMRKSFLTNLTSEECPNAFEEQHKTNEPVSNSSFLAHLQDKRARRLLQRMEKQANSSCSNPKRDLKSSPKSFPKEINAVKENYPPPTYHFNNIQPTQDTGQFHTENNVSSQLSEYLFNGNFSDQRSLDVINANSPLHASSLPPSANCSPIHYHAANASVSHVLRANSTPSSPFRSTPIPHKSSPPLRRLCLQSQLGHCYDECLSKSADSKYFSTSDSGNPVVYLRTRSLEESALTSDHSLSPSRNNGNKIHLSTNVLDSLSFAKAIPLEHYQSIISNDKNRQNMFPSDTIHQDPINFPPLTDKTNLSFREKTSRLLRLNRNSHKEKSPTNVLKSGSSTRCEPKDVKVKFKDACKGMARALFSYPNTSERSRVTRSHSPPNVVASRQTFIVPEDSSLSRQVRRRQHLLYAAESSPRNSFHYSCFCVRGQCNCPASRYRDARFQKSSPINRPSSAPNIGEGNLTSPFKKCHRRSLNTDGSTSDDDYAGDDYSSDECDGDDSMDDGEESTSVERRYPVTKQCRRSAGRGLRRGVQGGSRSCRSMPTGEGVVAVTRDLHPQRPIVRRRRRSAGISSASSSGVQGPVSSTTCANRTLAQQLALRAIHESYGTSDTTQCNSEEEEFSHDGSNCDLSRSWRYGLSRDVTHSRDSTLCSDSSCNSTHSGAVNSIIKIKSNSLPGAYNKPTVTETRRHRSGSSALRPKSSCDEDGKKSNPVSPLCRPPPTLFTPPPPPISCGRPTMGVQGLQRSPNMPRTSPLHLPGLPPSSPRLIPVPRTVAPRSPNNPNPPYGFSHIAADLPPPGSPRTSSRAKGLVSRNFSISDDESGLRNSRKLVTIVRNESVNREAQPAPPVDPDWLSWVSLLQ